MRQLGLLITNHHQRSRIRLGGKSHAQLRRPQGTLSASRTI